MKYLHGMLRVNNIEKSLKFYQNLLGLKIQSKSDLEDCTLYFLAETPTSPMIELTDNWDKNGETYKNGRTFGHFAFETKNMDEFKVEVAKQGYEFLYNSPFILDLKNEDRTIDKKKVAFLQDPDGNEIEIIEN